MVLKGIDGIIYGGRKCCGFGFLGPKKEEKLNLFSFKYIEW